MIDGRFRVVDDPSEPLELQPEDRPTPVTEDVLSALTEAQLIEILGLIGASQKFLLLAFNETMSPAARRPVRNALGRVQEARRLMDAVLGSTTRG